MSIAPHGGERQTRGEILQTGADVLVAGLGRFEHGPRLRRSTDCLPLIVGITTSAMPRSDFRPLYSINSNASPPFAAKIAR